MLTPAQCRAAFEATGVEFIDETAVVRGRVEKGGAVMLLYHFTVRERLPHILRDGLARGEVAVASTEALKN